VHLAVSGSLLILNRARPSAGIRRVIPDWHPLALFPLLYKEVELLAPAEPRQPKRAQQLPQVARWNRDLLRARRHACDTP